MPYYLADISEADQQKWQKYAITLDAANLAQLRAKVDAEATAPWSFKVARDQPEDLGADETLYVFYFKRGSDSLSVRDFDLYRKTKR
jgi:hypothetical protein